MRPITRRQFAATTAAGTLLSPAQASAQAEHGVWHYTLGVPEKLTPVRVRHYPPASDALAKLPSVHPPLPPAAIQGKASPRGYLVSIPLAAGELVYGLGLQLQSFLQRGLKKKLRVNADPRIDSGDSHAPVPFYVTTRGYGVLIDTARYATFYCGNKRKKGSRPSPQSAAPEAAGSDSLPPAYARFHVDEPSEVLIEIPEAQGADVYIFGGPTMRLAVQRYNLFAGGGALPPRWGLGFWYRCYGQFDQSEVLAIADELRRSSIPCDVLGLEPGWQSHAYSCSYLWSNQFPDPNAMLHMLSESRYRINLWEHAFVHPTSPLYKPLLPRSGDYEIWDGLVPDFLDPQARKIFADFHDKEHVSRGVAGYKLDECDNSDFTRNWSFPEIGHFPSGADGEQMHCLFGLRYQDTIQSVFDRHKTRTYGLVRSSHALAAPYPYVLYSDLYDHTEFIRGLVNAGFSGLLWCPEVRDARDPEDLIRRLQTVIFSPLAMVNAWYIKNPPWKQVDRSSNNAGDFAPGWEQLESACRAIIELRMQLIPYLYAAFVRYRLEGLPPFRALVMDYPSDARTWTVDNQFLAGESLLIAPVIAAEREREVYLPEGDWFDFWTGQRTAGKQRIKVAAPLDRIPVFVKSGALLPLAGAALHTEVAAGFDLTVRVYGSGGHPAAIYEDDGSPAPEFTQVLLRWDDARQNGTVERLGPRRGSAYRVTRWQKIDG